MYSRLTNKCTNVYISSTHIYVDLSTHNSIHISSIQICIDQVFTYSLMKQLSSVSIKCPRIDQVLMYQSSTHVYQSSTQMYIDQAVTYTLIMNSQLYWQRNSHLYWSITHIMYIYQVLTWVSIKHSYLSILYINQVFTCIDQEFIFVSMKRLLSVLIKYSYANQVRSIVVYRWSTRMYIDQVLTCVSMKYICVL